MRARLLAIFLLSGCANRQHYFYSMAELDAWLQVHAWVRAEPLPMELRSPDSTIAEPVPGFDDGEG